MTLPIPIRQSGFSMITASILLAAAAVILVSVLPGKNYNQQIVNNNKKLERIEEAMRSFMTSHGRRPCPADGQYAVGNAKFGIEAAIPGTCQGGTPSAPLGPDTGTGYIIGGVIPTKTLELPDDYAFDEWGHRITYVVDKRATTTGLCTALMNFPTDNGIGGIKIENTTNGTVIDNVMYAYIIHGQSGHGGWPQQGKASGTLTAAQSIALRINTGSTDQDENTNAGLNTDGSANWTNVRVQKSKTPTFDDTVWYRQDLKNTCCIGTMCIPMGFRIDGNNDGGVAHGSLEVVGIGDVNGDGISDLVLRAGVATGNPGYIYVIFGTSNSNGTNSSTPWPLLPTGLDPTTLNGTNGFVIPFNANFWPNGPVAVADINNDGYADIIIGGEWTGSASNATSGAIVFGGPTWPASVNLSNLSGYNTKNNGTSGVKILLKNTHGSNGGILFGTLGNAASYYPGISGIEVGKIDSDSNGNKFPAIIEIGQGGGIAGLTGFVIYGKPTFCSAAPAPPSPGCTGPNQGGPNGQNDTWANTKIIEIDALDGSTGASKNPGFQFYSSDTGLLPSETDYWGLMAINGITGDFDHDGYDDIAITDLGGTINSYNGVSGAANGLLHLLYGRPRAQWTASSLILNGVPAVDLKAQLTATGATAASYCATLLNPNPANCATAFYGGTAAGDHNLASYTLFITDINDDGIPDLLTSRQAIYGCQGLGTASCPTGGLRWGKTYDVNNITAGQGFYISSAGFPADCCAANYGRFFTSAFDVNGDGRPDILIGDSWAATIWPVNAGATYVIYQPASGFPVTFNYDNFQWDGSDSFQIYGPHNSADCDKYMIPWIGDVRSGDGGTPEILISCTSYGENNHGSVYGLYENKKFFNSWVSSIDLSNLN